MPSPFEAFYNRKTEDMTSLWADFSQVQTDWLLNRLRIIFPQNSTFTVLDMGCETGDRLLQIAELFPNAKLHGIETNESMIRQASQKLKSRAVITKSDLNEYHPQGRYDVVLSCTRLNAVDSPFDHIECLHAMTKPEGHLFVSELSINNFRLFLSHLWWSLRKGAHQHFHAWNNNDFRYFLKSSDFNIVSGVILMPDDFWRIQMYHAQPSHIS